MALTFPTFRPYKNGNFWQFSLTQSRVDWTICNTVFILKFLRCIHNLRKKITSLIPSINKKNHLRVCFKRSCIDISTLFIFLEKTTRLELFCPLLQRSLCDPSRTWKSKSQSLHSPPPPLLKLDGNWEKTQGGDP